jgi:hypothetical protein
MIMPDVPRVHPPSTGRRPMAIGRRVHYGLGANSPNSATAVEVASPLLDVTLSR